MMRLLSGLDSDSRFRKAQLNDPELAKLIADRYDPTVEAVVTPPRIEDWDTSLMMQSLLYDRLGEIAALIADLPTGVKTRHKPPARFPQPETLVDKAKKAKKAMVERAADDRLFGAIEKAQQRYRSMGEMEKLEYRYFGTLTRVEQEEYRALSTEEKTARLNAWRDD